MTKSAESDTIKTGDKTNINGNLQRQTQNTGAFKELPERMSKKHIREIADKYDIDISGLTLSIDENEELLNIPIAGETVPESIGKITFFPNSFRSVEELVRTLYHEREHVRQFKEYGVEHVQNNRAEFERKAYKAENEFIDGLKKAGKL